MKKTEKIGTVPIKTLMGQSLIALILFCSVIPKPCLYAVDIQGRDYASHLHFLQGLVFEKQGDFSKAAYEFEKTIELDKTAFAAYKELIMLDIQLGRNEEANELARTLAKLSQDISTCLFLGSYYVITGDTENAVSQYENVYSSQRDNIEAIAVLAGIYSATDPEKALKYLDKYLELKPDATEAYYRKALVMLKLKRNSEAKKILVQAIEKEPSESVLHITLSEIYEQEKDYSNAGAEMEKSADLNPDNFSLRISAGSFYFFAKNLEKAEKIFKSVLRISPDDPTALYWLSLVFEERKDWDMARHYLELIKEDKNAPDTGKYLRLSYYYSQLNDRRKAVKTLEKAAKLDPKSPEVRFFLALGYMDLKKYSKAEDNFLKVVELKPNMSEALFYLGVIYEQTGKFKKAIPHFKKVVELDPLNANAMNYLGYSYADRGEKLDEAETLIKKALEIDPDNGAYLDSLGWIFYKKGDLKNAQAYLEKAALKLKDPVIYEHLAEIEIALGNKPAALDYFRKAQELEPKNKTLKKKIKSLQK